MSPHLKGYWCIPQKQDADFVACMEDIIDVYERPYARKRPVVCLDEKPLQLLGEVREPLPMRPGAVEKIDAEYKRNGTYSIFAVVEPLTGHQHISVRERRTALNWAEEIRYLCDVMYPRAERIVLVMDNLNTHTLGSLYKRFKPDEARRLAGRLEQREVRAWENKRNKKPTPIHWLFTKEKARVKLVSLYPDLTR